jgi:hypothetical protein
VPIQTLSMSSGKTDGMKVIRFFKVIAFLGGLVWLIRALIVVGVLGGILFVLNGLL